MFSIIPPKGKIDTSQEAADSVAAVAGHMRQRVLDHVASCGEFGATADEIQLALGMRPQTCSARCNELLRFGLIKRSGQRRPTESGRSAHVYVIRSVEAKAVAP
ncbi:MAG: helix-turn-helix transcriptional regulator [Planctomycetaceae bacterium]|nr:helix-turn-helix transcriptional regulator [Planctomycetaceae bacterium]